MNKEVWQLVKAAERAGIKVTRTRKGHFKFHTPQGPVIAPSTPSCSRSIANTRASLRRHGVAV